MPGPVPTPHPTDTGFSHPQPSPMPGPTPTPSGLAGGSVHYDALTQKLSLTGTKQKDEVYLTQRGELVTLMLNGRVAYQTTADNVAQVDIQTLEGDDIVSTDSWLEDGYTPSPLLTAALSVHAGDGNDLCVGSNAANVLHGGQGNDVLVGGRADDALHGEQGNDALFGHAGRDRTQGGLGDDASYGGEGDDAMLDSAGYNHLFGGGGRDALEATPDGTTMLVGGRDADEIRVATMRNSHTVYAQGGDRVVNNAGMSYVYDAVDSGTPNQLVTESSSGSEIAEYVRTEVKGPATPIENIRIEGSDEFKSFVGDQLDAMAWSPLGREALQAISRAHAEHGTSLTLAEGGPWLNEHGGGRVERTGWREPTLRKNGEAGPKQNARFYYQRFAPYALTGGPPQMPYFLFPHELSHGQSDMTGTRQPGEEFDLPRDSPDYGAAIRELQTVGIPSNGIPYDHDDNPATPKTDEKPRHLQENGFREEAHAPIRTVYRG